MYSHKSSERNTQNESTGSCGMHNPRYKNTGTILNSFNIQIHNMDPAHDLTFELKKSR